MKTCVLTFDDGYRSHFDFVHPLLKEYGFNATFFICGAFIVNEETQCERLYMTWSEVKKLHENGFEIGNHLWKHVNMCRFSNNQLIDYIRILDEKLISIGVPRSKTFCYPGFHTDGRIIQLVKDSGFRFARSGCGKTRDFYDYQSGGFGSGFDKLKDDRHDVNCSFVFGHKYNADNFIEDIGKIAESETAILCFHDFEPDMLPVNISVDDFAKILEFLKYNKYQTLNFSEI